MGNCQLLTFTIYQLPPIYIFFSKGQLLLKATGKNTKTPYGTYPHKENISTTNKHKQPLKQTQIHKQNQ